MVVRCLRKGLLGTSEIREARHQEMPKINGYLIPHITHSCTLSLGKKAGLPLPEHGKSKLGFIAANLTVVKASLSGIRNLPEEFPRYHELPHQMTALSSGFMDLYK